VFPPPFRSCRCEAIRFCATQCSQPCGGLPRALNGTGRLSIVHPGRPKCTEAVFGQDSGLYRVSHVSLGRGRWTVKEGRDGGGRPEMVRDCREGRRTARVMPYDVKRICLGCCKLVLGKAVIVFRKKKGEGEEKLGTTWRNELRKSWGGRNAYLALAYAFPDLSEQHSAA